MSHTRNDGEAGREAVSPKDPDVGSTKSKVQIANMVINAVRLAVEADRKYPGVRHMIARELRRVLR
jgi:hypothetical protein